LIGIPKISPAVQVLRNAIHAPDFKKANDWLSASPTVATVKSVGGIATKLAVFVGLVAWIYESPDRLKAKQYQAWQILNLASDRPSDGGRRLALRDLIDDGAKLSFLQLNNAVLDNFDFHSAILDNATFRASNLESAQFGCVPKAYASSEAEYSADCKPRFRNLSFFQSILKDNNFRNTYLTGTIFSDSFKRAYPVYDGLAGC